MPQQSITTATIAILLNRDGAIYVEKYTIVILLQIR